MKFFSTVDRLAVEIFAPVMLIVLVLTLTIAALFVTIKRLSHRVTHRGVSVYSLYVALGVTLELFLAAVQPIPALYATLTIICASSLNVATIVPLIRSAKVQVVALNARKIIARSPNAGPHVRPSMMMRALVQIRAKYVGELIKNVPFRQRTILVIL